MDFMLTPLDPWIGQKIGQSGCVNRQALEEYQLKRLRATIDLARRVSPFYRTHLAVAPADLAKLEDLSQFPFTTAQELRERGLALLCVSQDEIQRVVTLDTTGTTGAPKRIYFTREDQELTVDFFKVGMSTFTRPGDTVLILLPCAREGSVGDLLAIALERMHVKAIRHGVVQNYAEVLDVIRQAGKINVIVGIPAQIFSLAQRTPELRVRSVLLSTDQAASSLVQRIQDTWHCEVFDHYGMTESGLGGGVECQAHRGLHLREADLLFEIIDPLSGNVLPEGQTGEIVFTTLTRSGMPLIRYRTGDLSRFIPGKCSCGTALKSLEKVRTRLDEVRSIAGDQTISLADLDEVIYAIQGIDHYSAAISSRGVELKVTIMQGFFSQAIEKEIHKAVQGMDNIRMAQSEGFSVNVSVFPADENPPAAGKRLFKGEN